MEVSGEDVPIKLIKRYTNRKLYDTVESRYVTLDEVAEMIRAGQEVRIVDNRSKEDLTSVTFAQIIFEQEKKRARMPLVVLRDIVRHGGVSVHDFFEREIQPRVVSIREGAEQQFEKIFRREREERIAREQEEAAGKEQPCSSEDSADGVRETGSSAGKECAAMLRLITDLREGIESWQRSFDHRVQATVRDAARLPVKAMNIPSLRKSLSVLRERIEDLDEKLADMEDSG